MNLSGKGDRLIISVAAAVAVFLVFAVLQGRGRSAEIRSIGELSSGTPVRRLRARFLASDSLQSGKIYSGDLITTADQKAVLQFRDGKKITIWPNSSVELRLDERLDIDATVHEGAIEYPDGRLVRNSDLQASPFPSPERLASPGLFLLPPTSVK